MSRNLFFSLSCFFLIVAVSTALDFDYYPRYTKCYNAEKIVKDVVYDLVGKDHGVGAGLIRMFFHDCFVEGCDASILLDRSEQNPDPEKFAIPNFPSLRGFEVIDAAKSKLEEECPGVVSCADIIAFAARDAASFLSNGKISYKIPSGRFDGKISIKDAVLPALPAPFHDVDTQIARFKVKGLSPIDLVTLIGAHSIGRSHCSSFQTRLYPNIDPNMDQGFGLNLRIECPQNATVDGVVPQDNVTQDILDKQVYDNIAELKGLFISDWSLLTNNATSAFLNIFRRNMLGIFEKMFAQSMIKMGNIEVKNGTQGEIRRSCRAINGPPTMAPPPVSGPPTMSSPPISAPPTTTPPPVSGPPTTAPPPVSDPPTTAPPPVSGPPTTAPPPVSGPPTTAPPPVYGPPTMAQPPVNCASTMTPPPPYPTY